VIFFSKSGNNINSNNDLFIFKLLTFLNALMMYYTNFLTLVLYFGCYVCSYSYHSQSLIAQLSYLNHSAI
jgi:hypothetical protein